MKNYKLTSLILSSFFILISCQNEKKVEEGQLLLTGEVKGLNQGKIYIEKFSDSTLQIIDSVIFKGNSTFETLLDIEEPQMLYLFLDRGNTTSIDNSLKFFAEPGKMNLQTSLKEFYAGTTVTGSKNNDLFTEFMQTKSRFNDVQMDLLEKEIANNTGAKNKETADSITIANQKLQKRKYMYVANFALTNSDKEIAPYLALTEIYDANLFYLDTIANAMQPKIAISLYGKKLKEFIAERKKTEK